MAHKAPCSYDVDSKMSLLMMDFFSTSWQRPKIRRAAGASALAHSNLRRFAPQEANDYDLCCRRERRRFRTRVVGAQNEHQNGAAKY